MGTETGRKLTEAEVEHSKHLQEIDLEEIKRERYLTGSGQHAAAG